MRNIDSILAHIDATIAALPPPPDGPMGWQTREIRRHLMHAKAAATDLYEALVVAAAYMAASASETGEPYPLEKARSALAKARGE